MGKTNITHKRTVTDKINIKDGQLNSDSTEITYLVDDIETTTLLSDILEQFAGKVVTLTISEKEEEDVL